MARWIDSPEHQAQLGKMCIDRTPITMIFEYDPDNKLDCIPVWLSGDAFCVIVDQDDDMYGVKRGTKIYGDPEGIRDMIVREKRSDE